MHAAGTLGAQQILGEWIKFVAVVCILNSRQIDSKNVNSEVFGGTPRKVVEVEKKQLT